MSTLGCKYIEIDWNTHWNFVQQKKVPKVGCNRPTDTRGLKHALHDNADGHV